MKQTTKDTIIFSVIAVVIVGVIINLPILPPDAQILCIDIPECTPPLESIVDKIVQNLQHYLFISSL